MQEVNIKYINKRTDSFGRFARIRSEKFKAIQNQYLLFEITSENQEHANQFH